MRSEGNRWDPATVIGLKVNDRTLVIGNAAFMPWISDACHDVSSARKNSEINALLRDKEEFDKVIIAREAVFSAEMISLVGPLLRKGPHDGGLLVAFVADDGWSVERAIEFYYPDANIWRDDSTFGSVIMSNPNGVSWRFYNG